MASERRPDTMQEAAELTRLAAHALGREIARQARSDGDRLIAWVAFRTWRPSIPEPTEDET